MSLATSPRCRNDKFAVRIISLFVIAIACGSWSIPAQDSPETRFQRSTLSAANTGQRLATSRLTELRTRLNSQNRATLKSSLPPSLVRAADTEYVVLNVEFDSAVNCSRLDVANTYPITRFERFVDLFV